MKLYLFPWGVYPRRVLVYLAEKGIREVQIVEMDVVAGENRKPDFLAKNPLGTMPLLEVGPGKYVRQSTAIIEYLEEWRPAPNLSGWTLDERSSTRQQMIAIHDAYLCAQFFTYYASPLMAQRRKQSAEAAEALFTEYNQSMTTVEGFAPESPFFGGESPSIADCIFFASAQFYETFYQVRIPESCARLRRVYQNFSKRPSATAPRYPQELAAVAPVQYAWRGES